jgi:hypothetical protein
MRYVTLYKWEKEPESDNWLLSERDDIPVLDVPAWEHNGWTRDRPAQPPATEPEVTADGRRRRSQEAAIA